MQQHSEKYKLMRTYAAHVRNTLMVFVLWLGIVVVGQAQEFDFEKGGFSQQQDVFLSVDEAFILSTSVSDQGELLVRWDMPDGYYLYRHQFDFESKDDTQVVLGEPVIAPGEAKVDEWFGNVEVYYQNAEARIALSHNSDVRTQLGISYQGCADAGLCYPPETRWFDYDGATLIPVSAVSKKPTASTTLDNLPEVAATEEQLLAGVLANDTMLYALALFFIAGIGLAFTPCVLPMVPILSSIIVGEGEGISKQRAFTLSLAYVLGMALTYAALGTAVGQLGADLNLQAALQSTPILVFFAFIFVLLSLSMFGFYELQLPQGLQNKLNAMGEKQKGGKYASVFVMGSLSSLVVSPCISAPLAGALVYISTTNDALLGGSALLMLGLGMGVPLMIVGGSGGHWLPRAGAWMDNVKAVFGVMLLGVAIWLLERVVPPAVTLALWATLLMCSGVYLGVLDFAPRKGFAQLAKAVGAMSFIWAVLLFIGAASGGNDPLKPLAKLNQSQGSGALVGAQANREVHWIAVKSLEDVEAKIAASDKPVLLDLYADWCISCKAMERNVFPEAQVAAGLAQFTLLRADVTDNDAIDRALLNNYGLFGPPSLVFFSEDGSEMTDVRIQGEVNAPTLARHLNAVLARILAISSGNFA